MNRFFLKPYRWAVLFSIVLIGSFSFVLLDTFVIPKSYQKIVTESVAQSQDTTTSTQSQSQDTTTSVQSQSESVVTDNSYQDDNIKITIETVQKYDSTIYIADIQVTDAVYLKTAFANSTYGRNIKDNTSDMAKANNAIFAINGD